MYQKSFLVCYKVYLESRRLEILSFIMVIREGSAKYSGTGCKIILKVTDLPIFGTSFLIVLFGSFGGERNARSFEDTERTVPGLKQLFLTSLFEWANASGHYHFISVHEMLSSCCFSL